MNLILLDPDEIRDSRVVLGGSEAEDRRATHLLRVLKVEPGRRVRLGVIGGGSGHGEVLSVTDKPRPGKVELTVEITQPPPPPSGIGLIVALPRPQALHRVLQSAAAMSVDRLYLSNAWRVEKSFFSSPSLRPETVRRHLILGAEQGRTTRLPEVSFEKLLVPFVSGLAEISHPPLRLIAHPDTAVPIEQALPSTITAHEPVEIAVGPEGGWIDREIETFGNAGFRPVSLGPWILRVETAVVAVLAQLELLRRLRAPDRA